jgi:hypothetical protein
MLEKKIGDPEKYLVYQGSVYSQHKRIPNEYWLMSEAEWEERENGSGTGNAVVLQRGLTREVANKMVNLVKEN